MPLVEEEDFGTNGDRSRNEEYCRYCFKNGDYTDPGLSMEQQIENVAETGADQFGIPKARARELARDFLPALKRWRK